MAAWDPAALMRAAHTLSGSLRELGAPAATALVRRLEALGATAGSRARQPCSRFEPELERVRAAAAEAIASGTPA